MQATINKVPKISAIAALCCGLVALLLWQNVWSADHLDTQELIDIGRTDAALTDLHAFVRGTGPNKTLVLSLASNSDVPVGLTAQDFQFPDDLVLTILIDNDSEVVFDNPVDPFFGAFNATVVNPNKIKEDILFKVRFNKNGKPKLNTQNLAGNVNIQFFAGLRDDPFIFTDRNGRNVGAVVLELPLSAVLAEQDTLLIWATSQIFETSHEARFVELTGRGMYSQFSVLGLLDPKINTLPPRKHSNKLGLRPAVLIYDTSLPAAWPNGRALTDDVVDPVLPDLDPLNNVNDKPFLSVFPYLAGPH